MKIFVVIYTEYSDTCDGLARVLGTYKTLEEAQLAMREDVDYNKNPFVDITEEEDNYIMIGDEDNGCLWQILEIDNG